jgi:hypothetical protein
MVVGDPTSRNIYETCILSKQKRPPTTQLASMTISPSSQTPNSTTLTRAKTPTSRPLPPRLTSTQRRQLRRRTTSTQDLRSWVICPTWTSCLLVSLSFFLFFFCAVSLSTLCCFLVLASAWPLMSPQPAWNRRASRGFRRLFDKHRQPSKTISLITDPRFTLYPTLWKTSMRIPSFMIGTSCPNLCRSAPAPPRLGGCWLGLLPHPAAYKLPTIAPYPVICKLRGHLAQSDPWLRLRPLLMTTRMAP